MLFQNIKDFSGEKWVEQRKSGQQGDLAVGMELKSGKESEILNLFRRQNISVPIARKRTV